MDNLNLYLSIINQIDDGVYYVDRNRTIKFWNKGAEKISGYSSNEIIGKHCNECGLNHIDFHGRHLCELDCPLSKTLIDGKIRNVNVLLKHKDGYRKLVGVKVFPIYDNDLIIGAVEIFKLIQSREYNDDIVDNLSKIAMTDTLTNLPNRRMGEAFLEHKVNLFKRENINFGIIYIDIDNFSNINNKYGHDFGDVILKKVTSILNESLRKTDLFCRWGGEEFLGAYSVNNIEELLKIAERIRLKVENTTTLFKEENINVTISLGATMFNSNEELEDLIRRADMLLYESKNTGKNKVSSDL